MLFKRAVGLKLLWQKPKLRDVGSLLYGMEGVDEHVFRKPVVVNGELGYLTCLLFEKLTSITLNTISTVTETNWRNSKNLSSEAQTWVK